MIDINSVIGMEKGEATKLLEKNKWRVRVMREDTESFMGTCEYRMDRVNLEIDKGLVTKVKLG